MLREICILCPPFKTLYYQSSWLKPTLAKAKANLAPSYTPCKRQHKIFILTGTFLVFSNIFFSVLKSVGNDPSPCLAVLGTEINLCIFHKRDFSEN